MVLIAISASVLTFRRNKNGWAIPEMFTVCATLIEKTSVDPAAVIIMRLMRTMFVSSWL